MTTQSMVLFYSSSELNYYYFLLLLLLLLLLSSGIALFAKQRLKMRYNMRDKMETKQR